MGVEQLCGVLPCEGWVAVRRHGIEGVGEVFEAEWVNGTSNSLIIIRQALEPKKRA
jgi:hypothetical protein